MAARAGGMKNVRTVIGVVRQWEQAVNGHALE